MTNIQPNRPEQVLTGRNFFGRHGLSRDPIYKAWVAIRRRCYRPSCAAYRSYGMRGIGIFSEWLNDPVAFVSYIKDTIGERLVGYSLDRIDNDKGYQPGNLKWSTFQDQLNNKRNNCVIVFAGTSKTASQWAEQLGIEADTITARIKAGKSAEDALSLVPLRGANSLKRRNVTCPTWEAK